MKIVRSSDPEQVRTLIDAFLAEKKLSPNEIASTNMVESETHLTIAIFYEDGTTS